MSVYSLVPHSFSPRKLYSLRTNIATVGNWTERGILLGVLGSVHEKNPRGTRSPYVRVRCMYGYKSNVRTYTDSIYMLRGADGLGTTRSMGGLPKPYDARIHVLCLKLNHENATPVQNSHESSYTRIYKKLILYTRIAWNSIISCL